MDDKKNSKESEIKKKVRRLVIDLLRDNSVKDELFNIYECFSSNPPASDSSVLDELEDAKARIEELEGAITEKNNETEKLYIEINHMKKVLITAEYKAKEKKYMLNESDIKLSKTTALLEECTHYADKLNQQNTILAEKNKVYKEKYDRLENVYESYKTLDADIRTGFSNILKEESPAGFIVSGTESDNLKMIWERISICLSKYSADEIAILNDVFNYLFELYTSVHGLYERVGAKVGDKFNDDLHVRSANSNVSGEIKEVLLDGYINVRNGKIVKSIVRM